MAPPAKSRKGKKAWRKNIDATEVEAFLEDQTYQDRRGLAAKDLQDEQLFFLDKTADVDGATAVVEGRRPTKRRREDAAAKPLRCQQILAEAHKAKPVVMAPPSRKPTATAAVAATTADKSKGALVIAGGGGGGSRRVVAAHPLDLWGDDLGLGAVAAATGKQQQLAAEAAAGSKEKKAKKAAVEDPVAAAVAAVRVMGPSAKALRRSQPPVRAAAVAVDIPGCSFNPDVEQHQDALALLVAAELKKELRKELLPSAPPGQVEVPKGARPLTELEQLQVEAASSDDEQDDEEADAERKVVKSRAAAADPNAIALEEEGEEAEETLGNRQKTVKKSRKERNKEARRKAVEAEAEERRRLKAQRRELQSLKDVTTQLEAEEAEKEVRRLRRAAMLEERAAVQPARLGKVKYEPPSVQVLTSDEKTGSLRQVVPCAMLAADRFKSLQQRGLLEPRKPQAFKEKRRRVVYEKGARFERAAVASAEVRGLSRRNKKARRQAKVAAAKGGMGGEEDF
ncbi:hypothetical protein VaNZ11_011333 [Volvox africanus]|uniref:Ribosome biogenesis protein NOP53 n=1 Tax=Volvox africanus TaxID=51714 RepID=A0ABQ5SB44_9CHLO|nr:hypothetical protein VaNZ11_011333 [Volvox africanus]